MLPRAGMRPPPPPGGHCYMVLPQTTVPDISVSLSLPPQPPLRPGNSVALFVHTRSPLSASQNAPNAPPSFVPTKIFPQQTDRSGKKVRCMFLANVAVGKAFTTFAGKLDPNANLCPPPGFDSVIGEVREKAPGCRRAFLPQTTRNKEQKINSKEFY